ncbi:MAG: DUF421 domain-containing protein, partial [Spirochaetia bacterium]
LVRFCGGSGGVIPRFYPEVFLLRISGKRTLSKMNAFDFVVTISLGSTLATVCLNKNITLAEGGAVFFTLIFLQYLLAWASTRIPLLKRMITSKPTMLLYKGKILQTQLRRARISQEELNLAVRQKGIGSFDEIEVVVMETTGNITVIPKIESGELATLEDIENYPPEKEEISTN